MTLSRDEKLKILKTKAEESDKTLIELAKQMQPLLTKTDTESRIKKLELQIQVQYHGWVTQTFNEIEFMLESLKVMGDLSTIIEKIIDQLSKITKYSGLVDKEIESIKQELEEQKKKVVETLEPLKQILKQTEEKQVKGNDIYG